MKTTTQRERERERCEWMEGGREREREFQSIELGEFFVNVGENLAPVIIILSERVTGIAMQ